MRAAILMSGLVIVLSACSSAGSHVIPVRSSGSARSTETARSESKAKQPARGPRRLNGVPPGHYPSAGECRLWYAGKPPGQQPRPTSCASLRGRVPAGAFVLYGDRAWDAEYDWAAQSRRERGSVPSVILDIMNGRR